MIASFGVRVETGNQFRGDIGSVSGPLFGEYFAQFTVTETLGAGLIAHFPCPSE